MLMLMLILANCDILVLTLILSTSISPSPLPLAGSILGQVVYVLRVIALLIRIKVLMWD
jgi:hypothetical protein